MMTASTGPHRFTMAGWISTAPFERLLNMTIVDAEDGHATLTMPFYEDYANGAGIMHGGALVSLADTAVVMAIKTLIEPESHFATISLATKFLHPVKKGVITAKAEVVSRVDRLIEGRAVIYDDEQRAVTEYLCTFKIARDTQLRGITFSDSASAATGAGGPSQEE
jgi:acyl-CoA thioesterase